MNPFGIVQPSGFPDLPEGWKSETETFPSADRKVKLFSMEHHRVKSDDSASSHRALVVVHGLGEHSGRYFHLPHYLKESFGAIYTYDQRGHGRSEGLRGHCDHFEQYSDDLTEFIARAGEKHASRFGKAEVHVLGHSFGGLVAIRTHFLNATLPVKSVLISAALLGVRVEIPSVKKLAAHGLSRIWGSLQLSNEIDARTICRDPAVVEAYKNDRLVHDKGTPRFYTEMTKAVADTMSRDSGFPYPLCMMVPLQDKIVDADAEERFYNNLKVRDKQLHRYPAFFHEIMNEPGKENVFEDMTTWVLAHSPN
jgi:alpha-beta hydrolase superfamily lysophospholipase